LRPFRPGKDVSVTTVQLRSGGPFVDSPLQREVEQFLFAEAELLDEWRLHEWLELFAPEGQYLIPTTDKPDGDPSRDLFLVQDDRFLLQQRVNSLLTRSAHAEYPHSLTRRIVSNVRASQADDATVDVAANVVVFRSRAGTVHTYVAHYRHVLLRGEDGGFQFLIRKSILDLDALRPHGKVSIIL
jgi:p-cumate 2,3-dioxygenase subunit beta